MRPLPKPLIFAAGAVLLALIGCGVYLSQNTEKKLLAKGEQAEFEAGDLARADKFYTRLSNKWSRKASGVGYWTRYGFYTRTGDEEQAAEMLRMAAAKGHIQGMFSLAHALLDGGDPGTMEYVAGIGEDVPQAIELLEKLTDEHRYSINVNYNAHCDLAEIYTFDPRRTDYGKAAEMVKRYFTGSYTKTFPRARHLGAILEYMGEGGFGTGRNPGHAGGLLNDATGGMAMYYQGNCWLRGEVYTTSDRLEVCLNKALDYYRAALIQPSRYIDREDLARRIEFLEQYSQARFEAHDRSQFYGQDRYYGVGPVDPQWEDYFEYNDFHYDGRRSGNGIGAGSWPRNERLFCGQWSNNRISEGIYVDEQGTVSTGKFSPEGYFTRGTVIDKHNNRRTIE